ncbi:MAG: adenosine deaminase [Acidobacteriota bacterium]|nr:adenosine deaminase [Acidobacteriota bacterium]
MSKLHRWSVCAATVTALFAGAARLSAQNRVRTANEQSTAAALARAAKNPLELRAFLATMPKGGELHFHLGGAVYAETILADAAEDQLCVDPVVHSLSLNQGVTKSVPAVAICAEGLIPASGLVLNNRLRDAMIDAWSMRAFVPFAGKSGHDQFFTSGLRVGTGRRHQGEWLDEVVTRAAAQNVQYLEMMAGTVTPNTTAAATVTPWNTDMGAMREALLAKGLRKDLALSRADLDEMEQTRRQREHCGTAAATPACGVVVRYLYTVGREAPPEKAFAQMLFDFEMAGTDPRVVGVNIAQPEDGVLSMSEYHRQMLMFQYLHAVYPKVHLSLHAGELAFGMVPPDGLKFHIREAVEIAHAERIGHGVDVMYEDNPHQLLQEMAAKHIMVEINLTSNDGILGVKGNQHPLPLYLAAHVPISFSTDDEGVSRIDLTHEYQRAVEDCGLGYLDLKRSARTSIEHSFLAGADLWARQDDFTKITSACTVSSSASCAAFLKGSDKAEQEMELEHRFTSFEAKGH